MRTRRGILGGCVGVMVTLAGCDSQGEAGTDSPTGSTPTETAVSGPAPEETTAPADEASATPQSFEAGGTGGVPYDDWYGPEMASVGPADEGDVENYVGAHAHAAPRIRSNDALPDWFQSRVPSSLSTTTGAEFDFGEDSIDWWIGNTTPWSSIFLQGEFDTASLESGMPEAASHEGVTRGAEVYTAPTQDGRSDAHEAYAIGGSHFLTVRRMPDPETAVDAARRTLQTKAGDRDGFAATSGDFARIVRDLGDGFFVRLFHTDARSHGIRLRSQGSMLHRRAVYVYQTVTDANDDFTTNADAVQRQQESGDADGPRTRRNRFTVYEQVDRRQDGRHVVIDGTLPIEEFGSPELEP